MDEISENIFDEELNKLLLLKIQFRENYTWMSPTWRSRNQSEEIQNTHCLSRSVSLNLKDNIHWRPIRVSSTRENTFAVRIGGEGSSSSRKLCKKLPRNWRIENTVLSGRKYGKNNEDWHNFPTQHDQESRTVSLFFYDPDLLSSYVRSSSSSCYLEFKKA